MPAVAPQACLAELAFISILILDVALKLSVTYGFKQKTNGEKTEADIIAPNEGLLARIRSSECL